MRTPSAAPACEDAHLSQRFPSSDSLFQTTDVVLAMLASEAHPTEFLDPPPSGGTAMAAATSQYDVFA